MISLAGLHFTPAARSSASEANAVVVNVIQATAAYINFVFKPNSRVSAALERIALPYASERFVIVQTILPLDVGFVCAYRKLIMKTIITRNNFAKLITVSMISAFALGACGIKGDLKTPPPLWGDKDKPAKEKPAEDKPESNN